MKANLKSFLEAIKYQINDGGKYCWNCYGRNVFMLDSHNQKGSVHIVFDTENHTIYEFRVCDYIKNVAYKWINPKYLEKFHKEMKTRKIKEDQAWDSVNYEPLGLEKIMNYAKIVTARKK